LERFFIYLLPFSFELNAGHKKTGLILLAGNYASLSAGGKHIKTII